MELSRPEIFKYTEYRKFLADFFNYRKSQKPQFSFQFVANALKTSRGYFKNVIDSRRHLSIDKVPGITKVFSLEKIEAEYLIMMILKESSSEQLLVDHFEHILRKMRAQSEVIRSKGDYVIDAKGVFQSYHWLAAAIQELVNFPDFQPSAVWIREKLIDGKSVELQKIEEIWEHLIKIGAVKEEDGRYRWGGPLRLPEVPTSIVGDFLAGQSLIAKSYHAMSDSSTYRPARFFSGIFRVKGTDLSAINDAFLKYHQTVVQLSENSVEPDTLLHLTGSFYNLVKISE